MNTTIIIAAIIAPSMVVLFIVWRHSLNRDYIVALEKEGLRNILILKNLSESASTIRYLLGEADYRGARLKFRCFFGPSPAGIERLEVCIHPCSDSWTYLTPVMQPRAVTGDTTVIVTQ